MIAFDEGKPVEHIHRKIPSAYGWPCPRPDWNWGAFDFRVTPQEAVPRTVEIHCDRSGNFSVSEWPDLLLNETITFTGLPPGWEVRRKETES